MKKSFKILIKCILLSSCLNTATVSAQILQDTASLNLIKKGVDCIYNRQFNCADEIYSKISEIYPKHPIVVLFNGIKTYWEYYPLTTTSAARVSFEEDMRCCIKLCEENSEPSNKAEILLANLCARALLLSFYADNALYADVLPLATSSYQYLRSSFDFTTAYSDFFFFTGLYNYYREAYPRVHSLYRPLAFFFPKGNRAKGVKELQAATNSIFLKAESFYFLSLIYISYENNFQQAFNYSKNLYELYPANLEYQAMYIKNLLLVKRYDEAERLMNYSGTDSIYSYYQAQRSIFNGILQEKKYHDYKLAQKFYVTGAREIANFGDFGNDFAAYAYFGLSRISEANGDKYYKKIYRKKATELAYSKKLNFDE